MVMSFVNSFFAYLKVGLMKFNVRHDIGLFYFQSDLMVRCILEKVKQSEVVIEANFS